MSLFWNMLRFGGAANKAFLRDTGTWFTWNGTHSSGSLNKPTRKSGDLLMVCVWAGDSVNFAPKGTSATEWSRINAYSSLEIWTRIATNDGDDDYDYDSLTGTGNSSGAAQMCSIGGLGWTARGYWDTGFEAGYSTSNEPATRNGRDFISTQCDDLSAAAQDSIVVHHGYKLWTEEPITENTAPSMSVDKYADTNGYSGTATVNNSDSPPVLTDSNFPKADETGKFQRVIGKTLRNLTDGSSGTISAFTNQTVTAELSGGTNNYWTIGDSYSIAVPTLEIIGQKTWVGENNTRALAVWGWRFDEKFNDARVAHGNMGQSPLDSNDLGTYYSGTAISHTNRIIEDPT